MSKSTPTKTALTKTNVGAMSTLPSMSSTESLGALTLARDRVMDIHRELNNDKAILRDIEATRSSRGFWSRLWVTITGESSRERDLQSGLLASQSARLAELVTYQGAALHPILELLGQHDDWMASLQERVQKVEGRRGVATPGGTKTLPSGERLDALDTEVGTLAQDLASLQATTNLLAAALEKERSERHVERSTLLKQIVSVESGLAASIEARHASAVDAARILAEKVDSKFDKKVDMASKEMHQGLLAVRRSMAQGFDKLLSRARSIDDELATLRARVAWAELGILGRLFHRLMGRDPPIQ